MIALILGVLLCLGYYVYLKGTANKDFFSGDHIKFSKPSFIFGHSRQMMMRKIDFFEHVKELYDEFPGEKANAVWDMRTPMVLIRDTDLLKRVTVKDFDHFTDHRILLDENIDPILGNSLVSMTGDKWKEMRANLSPAFTGSKMRKMYQLILEVTGQLTSYLKEQESGRVTEQNIKDVCAKYTNDLIAICAFGVQVDSLKEPGNLFFKIGRSVMDTKLLSIIRMMLLRFLPTIAKMFDISIMNRTAREYFSRAILETMKMREEQKIVRPDLINLLMDLRKGNLQHEDNGAEDSVGFATINESEVGRKVGSKRAWTDIELIAQCTTFFFAGFETSSTVMAIAAYELTLNPEVQQKLYEEIKETERGLNGKPLSFEALRGMQYLDQVVSETLRKWTPAPFIDRKCTKDFHLEDQESGMNIRIKKGDNIWIPIYGFHRDHKHFPEPEKFLPERFAVENDHLRNPDAYFPFGIGPRSCIANRFALMEVKAFLYSVLLNFELVVTERTNVPLKITNNFGAIANDMFVGFKARE